MPPYRAHHYVLERAGLSLGDVAAALGRSRTTASRLLAAKLSPEPRGGREAVERLLQEHGHPVPADLWLPELAAGEADSPNDPEVVMQAQTLSPAAQKAWALFQNPFEPEAILDPRGGDRLDDLFMPIGHRVVEAKLVMTFLKAGFVAVGGEPGSGKSTLLERALRQASETKQIIKVSPANIERRKLTAMHVSAEIIRQLSEDRPGRTANVRDAQAAEILRQRYEQGQRVALVIDEAHELPANTIKDLKRFHEMRWGFAQLLGIVLIGQSELANRFQEDRNHALREVIIRCELMMLPPMKGEVRGYLAKRFSWVGRALDDVFEPAAVDALEDRLAVHKQQYPILIGNAATISMNVAAMRGNPRVMAGDVEAVWAYTPEQRRELGL